jgi:hypothetical protein
MSPEHKYRRYAAKSLDLASNQSSNGDKGLLLVMAEAWLDLADRIARRGTQRSHSADHPLVEKALGPDQTGAE